MPNDKETGKADVVTLRDRFLISPASPLPDLSTPSADAFLAEDRRERGRPVFALVVKPGIPSRLPMLRTLKGQENPGLLSLIEWGVTDWPPADRKAMIIIYARPMGGRLWGDKGSNVRRVDEADIVLRIVKPAIAALKQLNSLGITHRAIRPSNMFWMSSERDRAVFGDGASAPPGLDQPSALEPVECALSQPEGRGDGTNGNDIYSFGASLAMILQGRDIAVTSAEEAIIRHKIVMGSYSALAGEARLPLSLVEILRGMLCDDVDQRWNAEALDLWLNGRRLTPLVPRIEKRAIRAFPFSGKEYWTGRELAIGIFQNWDKALVQLGDGKLELWLSRAADNKPKGELIANILAGGADNPASDKHLNDDITIAKICMILDTKAPLRYKNMSTMIDGIRWLLPMTMAKGGDVRTIASALIREMPKAWYTTREVYSPENSVLDAGFRTQKGYLDRALIGYGLERVVYELNDGVPCLSPLVVDEYVLELRDLLSALNAYAKKKGDNAGAKVIDRHIAAFIMARANFDIERMVGELGLPDPARVMIASINVLAVVQWRLGLPNVSALTSWLAQLARPAIKSYHNRARRAFLEKELPRVGRDGNLIELSRLLDSSEERGNDFRGFEEAKTMWTNSHRQMRAIEEGHEEIKEESTRTGQQVASLISVTLAFIAIAILLLKKFV